MDELKRLRLELGWSQQRLADESGVNKATINQVEQGKRSPSIATLESLARAMGAEVGDFFPKAQPPLFAEPPDRGAEDPAIAAAKIDELGRFAAGLAAVWNADVDLYERHGRQVQPYRAFEMSAVALNLYEQFFGAIAALQRHARDLGLDPDVKTWEPRSKRRLVEVAARIRALAELYDVINRSTADPGVNRGDFRALREEFDAGAPAHLADDPGWPEAMEEARAEVGLA